MRIHAPVFVYACLSLVASDAALPIPEAPLRLIIPDVKAFDGALTGSYRAFLNGQSESDDALVSSWRKTQVGSKLEDQWIKFSGSLPLTWDAIQKLQPRSLGLSLLDVGNLEAVMVVDTSLANLPLALPAGQLKNHGGVPYTVVTRGAGDKSEDPDRRMGLAWARKGSRLFLSTSERALKLALEEALKGREMAAPLSGLVSMDLDLDALRKDRYFKREFLFEPGPETGHLKTALRFENNQLVEIREGIAENRGSVPTFRVSGAASAGWEPEGTAFWPAFRRGLLEPVPSPAELPAIAMKPLPEAGQGGVEDRYAVDFTRPKAMATAMEYEKGDLTIWSTLLTRNAISSWGYWISPNGTRRMVFPWPEAQDSAFQEACRTTLLRRAGRATAVKVGETTEFQMGPGLPALALRRTGAYLWVSSSAAALKDVSAPQADNDLVRWAQLDLGSVRREAARWTKVEGPGSPEQVRPFSDRVMGWLGWMPQIKAISVERRKTANGWRERVVFTANQP